MRLPLLTATAILCAGSAYADGTFFAGLSWTFGGGSNGTPGVTVKYLSTDEANKAALAAGVTYNFDSSIGCDVGAGVTSDNIGIVASYDICQGAPQLSVGAVNGADEVVVVVPD